MEFKLTVYRETDGVTSISVDATDEQAALRQATANGYSVLSTRRSGGWTFGGRRDGAFPLLLVSQELLSLLRAGLNLVEAFETLAEKEQTGGTKTVLDRILAELYSGKPLSAALETFPGAFSPLYVATIRASERTGDIQRALERYVAYQSQLDRVRKSIVTAMIYPVLLIGVGGAVTLFLLGYVVPKFSRIFVERGTDLPWLTGVLVEWGTLLNEHSWQIGLAALAALALLVIAAARPEARALLVRQLWKVPGAGEKMRLFQLARMYRTLGMLLQGGMPIFAALGLVRGLLDPSLRGQLARATKQIGEGGATSQAMLDHGLSTPVATRMLRVGEQTGELGGMMERIAAFYDEELARTAEVFTRAFEPALMVLIGVIIGGIVLLMYLPIFELASSIE
ncbi:MAG: type II secretion system F family protein [Betaproteobacteria bacterium]|nr:type II secretion system F family protein [Betaproteobacteria bacterium]